MVFKDYAGGIVASMDKSSVTNCYSTGFVNSETAWSVGGIVGKTHAWRTDYNTLKNNVAISAKINGQLNNSNRIVGYSYGNITLSNNYAWKDLYVSDSKITNGTHDNKNGQNVTLDGVKSEAFYTYAANWDTEPWDFTNTWEINASVSPYPILKNIPADAQKVKHSQVMTTPWEQELPSNAKVLDEVVLVAIADGPSGLVSFSSEDSTVASLSGNILTAQTVGESAIHAFYPETEFYKASNSFSNLIMVTQKLDQTISWDQVLSMIYGDNMNLTATASSGLDIEYVISDESVASVSGNTLTAKGVGYTMITATQPGNNSYNAAENQKVVDLNVSPMQLMIGGEFSVSNKEYDGTKSATISENNLILLTPLSGDDVNLTGIVVEFTDSITGNNKEVHIVEAQLDGADKSNYILTLGSAPSTVASITAVTGINENLFAGIKIYPNPFCEYINMESNDNIECITVTNVLGQNVMNMNLKGQKTISTSHLDTGIYFISVKTQDGQSATFRMIKR